MPQFDAEGIAEGLECRLKPYADFDGLIPEPSDQQIGEFLSALKRAITGARERMGAKEDIDVTDPDQVAEAVENLEPAEFVKMADEMAALHADLCSGTPSKAQILAVPLRRRTLFYQWLQGEVMSPEAGKPAGNERARTLPPAAAA